MSHRFRVRVLEFTVLQEIEGARTSEQFATLLDAMEFGDRTGIGADELRDACVMGLQDLEPAAAAALVLTHDMGDAFTPGQIRNIARDMLDEKMWEEYADMEFHERLFHVGSLLYAAFPGSFPEPDAVRVRLEITAANDDAADTLREPLHESLLVRLLAGGMDDRSVLHRLFEDQLSGTSFPEATEIVWIVETETPTAPPIATPTAAADPRQQIVQVISSGHWLDALRDTTSYDSTAHADG